MTVLNLVVGSDADDAEERENGFGFSSTSSLLRWRSSTSAGVNYIIGTRFTGGPTQGATIDEALWSVWFWASGESSPDATIYGEAIDSAPDYSTNADVNGRTPTSASVSWDDSGLGNTAYQAAPDALAVVQEVTDRAGYTGNLNILAYANNSSSRSFDVRGYAISASQCPKLDITYTAGGGGSSGGLTTLGVG